MNIILNILNRLPLKDYIIFESNPDFSDNTYWLFKYMAEKTDLLKRYKCLWFVGNPHDKRRELCGVKIKCIDNVSKNLSKRILRFYYTWFAKIIIDCNRCIHKRRANQYRIYLTHGMPIKIPDAYMRHVGECDLLPVSGEGFVDFFSRYINQDSIKNIGNPRNDILIINKTVSIQEKYLVWMPTFRQHKESLSNKIKNEFPFGLPVLKTSDDIYLLEECLRKFNIKMMLRPHPSQDMSVFKIQHEGNIIIADDEYLNSKNLVLYDFISKSSGLITDYSSIYLDYLFLDKPIGLTFEDAEEFSKQWPLYFKNIEKELPGCKLDTINDLCDFIKSISEGIDETANDRKKFMSDYCMKETNSCKNILDILIEEGHI